MLKNLFISLLTATFSKSSLFIKNYVAEDLSLSFTQLSLTISSSRRTAVQTCDMDTEQVAQPLW